VLRARALRRRQDDGVQGREASARAVDSDEVARHADAHLLRHALGARPSRTSSTTTASTGHVRLDHPLVQAEAKVVVTFHSLDRFHKNGASSPDLPALREWAAARFPHATIAVSRSINGTAGALKADAVYIPTVRPSSPPAPTSRPVGLKPEAIFLTVARLVRLKASPPIQAMTA